jgi:glycosyltransferase involved in cell wall biosynthesis
MRIIYAARTILDYRIAVFKALKEINGVDLFVLLSGDATPASVKEEAHKILPGVIQDLHGEKKIVIGDPSKGLSNKWFRLPYQPGIIKLIRSLKPDVLVGDGFFQWTFYLLIVHLLDKKPLVICYERTHYTERNAQWIRKVYRRFVLRHTSAICCSGSLCKEYVLSLGVGPERITVGHMVVDVGQFSNYSPRLDEPEEMANTQQGSGIDIRFLYVGSLIDKKGILQLIKAWIEWSVNEEPNAVLSIVGTGYLEDNLQNLVRRSNVDNVIFLGTVENKKLPSVYKKADVFIIPTLEDNWSLVVPEAMASGLPICTSKYNGCWPDLVFPDKNGWIFDPYNEESIISTLREVALNRNRLSMMGAESAKIISEYNPQRAAKSIHNAILIAYNKSIPKLEG